MATDSFCPYLENSLMISRTSEIRPCCRFDTSKYNVSDFIWDNKTPLNEFYNSPVFTKLRQQSQNGEKVSGCHRCYREEEMGILSMRQKAFPGEIVRMQQSVELPTITFAELGAGRICNLKCRSCDPYFSTKWESDAKEVSKPLPDPKSDVDLDKIDAQFFKDVQMIKVTGGEPFYNPGFERLLDRIAQQGYSKNIELEIFSNATQTPSARFMETLKSFRKVNISLSIDGFKEKNTYIRFPSQWSTIEKTCHFWIAETQKTNLMQLNYAITVSIFNVLYLFELFRWLFEIHKNSPPNILIQTVQDPRHLNVALWPAEVRRKIHELFQAQEKKFVKEFSPNKSFQKRIQNIVKMLRANSNQGEVVSLFWKETVTLDQRRKENFQSTFPELHQLILPCLVDL
jgi:organic radical activating enzyme